LLFISPSFISEVPGLQTVLDLLLTLDWMFNIHLKDKLIRPCKIYSIHQTPYVTSVWGYTDAQRRLRSVKGEYKRESSDGVFRCIPLSKRIISHYANVIGVVQFHIKFMLIFKKVRRIGTYIKISDCNIKLM